MKARQKEIHDNKGNLLKIEVTLENGDHLFDILWDDRDAQTEENRVAFREWAKRMVKRNGHELT